ncbi:DUF3237 domain-containing protein [Sphingomonas glacialis]|nr:DUF3237 domain-containing protein [Sphingomonas glacialis]
MAESPPPIAPALEHAFSLFVDVAVPQEQGVVDGRQVRFVAITGERVAGPRLQGVVLPGGGDWQAIHADGLALLETRYAIRADDGTVIGITNPAVRVASEALTHRLAHDEPVDPSEYYFRSTPRFTVPDGDHGWLRRHIFVGVGIRRPTQVEIQVFAVA